MREWKRSQCRPPKTWLKQITVDLDTTAADALLHIDRITYCTCSESLIFCYGLSAWNKTDDDDDDDDDMNYYSAKCMQNKQWHTDD